jgi:hypothetical protein
MVRVVILAIQGLRVKFWAQKVNLLEKQMNDCFENDIVVPI